MPEIAPDEVVIQVRACGICGSDVHGLDGSTGRRIPSIVMGHEAAGITETVAMAIRTIRKGGSVALVGNLAPNVEIPFRRW